MAPLLATTALTLAAVLLGLRLQEHAIALFWPAAGVAAGLLLAPPHGGRLAATLGVTLALVLGNLVEQRSAAAAIVFMGGNLLEAWLIVLLLGRSAEAFALDRVGRVVRFVAAAVVASAAVGMAMASGLIGVGHAGARWIDVWWIWFSSHLVGIVTIAPALLALRTAGSGSLDELAEDAMLAVAFAVAALVTVGGTDLDLPVVVFLCLVTLAPLGWWVWRRAGVQRAALALLAIGAATIWMTSSAEGLFAGDPAAAQAFLLAAGLLLLAGGALRAQGSSRVALTLDRHHAAVALVPLGIFALLAAIAWREAGVAAHLDPWLETMLPLAMLALAIAAGSFWLTRETARGAARRESARSQELLREQALHLNLALRAARSVTFDWDIVGDRIWRLRSREPALPATGELEAESFGRFILRIHPEDREKMRADLRTAFAHSHGEYRSAYRALRADGTIVWMQDVGQVEFDSAGQPVRLMGIAQNVSEQRQAEEELQRHRDLLRTVLASTPDLIWAKDLEGKLTLANDATVALLGGGDAAKVIGRDAHDLIADPEQARLVMENDARIVARGTAETLEENFGTGAQLRIFQSTKAPLRDGKGRVIGIVGVTRDVTEQRRHEEHMRLLTREISHRSRNLLGLVLAIARQTVARDPIGFVPRLEERLQALAASDALLAADDWRSVSLADLVDAQLAHFRDLVGDRIRRAGPEVRVNGKAAQAIGMALHELATNAGKYGALTDDKGTVEIAWSLRDDAGRRRFRLSWIETCGSPIAPPDHRGFGTVLVETMTRANLGADLVLDFPPSGAHWQLECDAPRVIESAGDAAAWSDQGARGAERVQGSQYGTRA